MERAETLTRLRGDATNAGEVSSASADKLTTIDSGRSNSTPPKRKPVWQEMASKRLPPTFLQSTPKNAQELILWCLAESPGDRPSAEEILSVSACFAMSFCRMRIV